MVVTILSHPNKLVKLVMTIPVSAGLQLVSLISMAYAGINDVVTVTTLSQPKVLVKLLTTVPVSAALQLC